MTDSLSDLHRLTEAVRTAGVDIAPTYREYIQLAFAIATDCGEAGRSDFMTLCSLSPKYNDSAADHLYTSALRSNKNDVHLATAFHLAALCNVKVHSPHSLHSPSSFTPAHTHAYNKVKKPASPIPDSAVDGPEETLPGSEPLTPLPTFNHSVNWPDPLNRILRHGSTPAQQDILLLGAITVLGSTMGEHVRCLYGGRMMSPCLQTFVVAPPASGKGVLSLVRLLVEPIHDEIRSKVAAANKQYQKDKTAYDIMGKERSKATLPTPPPNRMFLISGNNTGTGILQNIIDSNGTGLICESEADTLSSAIGSDYGHWSDTMRKAFDHDRLSYNRRTDKEYREVKRMFLSILLSGTPAQVKPLIPTAENGLFSRQIFYYMPAIHQWQNQFDRQDTNLDEVFTAIGMEWKSRLQTLIMGGLFTLHLTNEQKDAFNNLFAHLFVRACLSNGDEMSSSVARLAINICRIMEVVAMLRVLEAESPAASPYAQCDTTIPADNQKDGIITRWDVSISPHDFDAVMSLTEGLYRHATHILSFLPGTEISHRSNADRDALLHSMGLEFTRTEFLQKAEQMNIKTSTATTWLRRLTRNKLIESVDGNGLYRKHLVFP